MNTSVVLVPGAPVLVPELSGAAGAEVAGDVAAAIGLLADAARGAGAVEVWGHDALARGHRDVRASLRRWGADVTVGRPEAPVAPDAAVSDPALLAWWFLDRAGVTVPRSFVPVRPGGSPAAPTADLVVVVADGPASLTPRAPVPEDPRGVELEADLTAWIRGGGALPDSGAEVAGAVGWWSRPAWIALAGLVADRPATASVAWAPFGVGYHCARWDLPSTGGAS